MSETGACDVLLQFSSADETEDAELDRLARRLNIELQQEEIESALAPDLPVGGTRSAMGAAVGALAVKIMPAMIPLLIERVRKFLARSQNRAVKINVRIGKNTVAIEYPTEASVSSKDIADLVKKLSASVDSGA